MPSEKDYYSILKINITATPEQIKEAYREAAKKYHPDLTGSSEADAKMFRDVMEAYGVLSVRESRVNYDLLRRKNSKAFVELSQEEFDRSNDVTKRDARGEIRTGPAPGSYAELRMKDLAE